MESDHHVGTKVLDKSLARLSGAAEPLIDMDLSHASAALQRVDQECSCPLEMICAIAEADTCLADSAGSLRHVKILSVAIAMCLGALCCSCPPLRAITLL